MDVTWTLKVCPECGEAVALVNAPVHKQGCSHPTCEHVQVIRADAMEHIRAYYETGYPDDPEDVREIGRIARDALR